MLQVPYIRENRDAVIKGLAKRNLDATAMIDEVIALDENRRRLQTQLDATLAESNNLSKDIGALYKSGETSKANILKEKTAQLKDVSKTLGDDLDAVVESLNQLLYKIPNIPADIVPNGSTADDNEEVFRAGDIPVLHANAQPHWELAKKYDINDFELCKNIKGAGFHVLIGKCERVQ